MNDDELMPEQIEPDEHDPRIQAALQELRDRILERFPDADFVVSRRDDPDGIYLTAIVDVEDLDEVTDPIISRIVDMQVDEGLPVYVVGDWPEHRIRAYLRQKAAMAAEARQLILAP